MVATSFTLAGADPQTRPVTFAVNGGPGASSAWLDLGAIGPWRLPFAGAQISPSAAPHLVDNAETWLPFTDLVFLDPPGTGWARVLGGPDAQKTLWSVKGDISSLAVAIRSWLLDHDRLASPKIIAGESYGGFRAPLLVAALRQEQGIGIGSAIMLSPIFDFGHRADTVDPWSWMTRLPSYAAIARQARSRADVKDAEAYAAGDFLVDFTKGESDDAAVARMSDRVAQLTGLDPAVVRRHDGRIDPETFLKFRGRAHGTLGSLYDGTVTAIDPFPAGENAASSDAVLDTLRGRLGSAAMMLYRDRLHWRGQGPYHLLADRIAHAWDYGSGPRPDSEQALRRDLALDSHLRALVVHGLYDLVTPYFATKLLLDQMPPTVTRDRVRLVVLPGGHMLYSRDASRAALRDAARWAVTGQDAVPASPR